MSQLGFYGCRHLFAKTIVLLFEVRVLLNNRTIIPIPSHHTPHTPLTYTKGTNVANTIYLIIDCIVVYFRLMRLLFNNRFIDHIVDASRCNNYVVDAILDASMHLLFTPIHLLLNRRCICYLIVDTSTIVDALNSRCVY